MNEEETILAEYLIKVQRLFDFDYINDTNADNIFEVIRDEQVVSVYSVEKQKTQNLNEVVENWFDILNKMETVKEEYFIMDKLKENLGKKLGDSLFVTRTQKITKVSELLEIVGIKTDNETLKETLTLSCANLEIISEEFLNDEYDGVLYKGYIITKLES